MVFRRLQGCCHFCSFWNKQANIYTRHTVTKNYEPSIEDVILQITIRRLSVDIRFVNINELKPFLSFLISLKLRQNYHICYAYHARSATSLKGKKRDQLQNKNNVRCLYCIAMLQCLNVKHV